MVSEKSVSPAPGVTDKIDVELTAIYTKT